jgi:hypothetical protein
MLENQDIIRVKWCPIFLGFHKCENSIRVWDNRNS